MRLSSHSQRSGRRRDRRPKPGYAAAARWGCGGPGDRIPTALVWRGDVGLRRTPAAIEAVYAGGLETELAFGALAATSRLLGAVGATMEVIDKPARRHTGFWSYGRQSTYKSDYVEQFAAISLRIRTDCASAPAMLVGLPVLDGSHDGTRRFGRRVPPCASAFATSWLRS